MNLDADTPSGANAEFIRDLDNVIAKVRLSLIQKNIKYGNSALEPIRCFSKLSPIEGINIRMDDKIKRIINQQTNEDEDPEFDLVGYILLKMIAKKRGL